MTNVVIHAESHQESIPVFIEPDKAEVSGIARPVTPQSVPNGEEIYSTLAIIDTPVDTMPTDYAEADPASMMQRPSSRHIAEDGSPLHRTHSDVGKPLSHLKEEARLNAPGGARVAKNLAKLFRHQNNVKKDWDKA